MGSLLEYKMQKKEPVDLRSCRVKKKRSLKGVLVGTFKLIHALVVLFSLIEKSWKKVEGLVERFKEVFSLF